MRRGSKILETVSYHFAFIKATEGGKLMVRAFRVTGQLSRENRFRGRIIISTSVSDSFHEDYSATVAF